MSSQMNSSVYVAVLVLQPRRQTNVFPYSPAWVGIFPVGYLVEYAWREVIVAFPLIDARGLMSHDGEMYTSF